MGVRLTLTLTLTVRIHGAGMGVRLVTARSTKAQALHIDMSKWCLGGGCQMRMGVRWVSDLSQPSP